MNLSYNKSNKIHLTKKKNTHTHKQTWKWDRKAAAIELLLDKNAIITTRHADSHSTRSIQVPSESTNFPTGLGSKVKYWSFMAAGGPHILINFLNAQFFLFRKIPFYTKGLRKGNQHPHVLNFFFSMEGNGLLVDLIFWISY